TTTANASGVYTFSSRVAGAYTVTPGKLGFAFTPTNRAVTITTANVTADFSSAVQLFTISGTIGGAGGSGATGRLTGTSTATVTANTSGIYTFTNLAVGSYTVTPSKTGFLYTPASQAVTLTTANVTANFATQTFTISGTITGAGGNLATVKLTGSATATVTASAAGAFSFTGLTKGTYTITPSKSGHIIIPSSSTVNLATANVTGVTFLSN